MPNIFAILAQWQCARLPTKRYGFNSRVSLVDNEDDKLSLFYLALYKDKTRFLEELDKLLAKHYAYGYEQGRYADMWRNN